MVTVISFAGYIKAYVDFGVGKKYHYGILFYYCNMILHPFKPAFINELHFAVSLMASFSVIGSMTIRVTFASGIMAAFSSSIDGADFKDAYSVYV